MRYSCMIYCVSQYTLECDVVSNIVYGTFYQYDIVYDMVYDVFHGML